MAWNRKKIIEFCNKEIFPQVHTHIGNELMDVVKMVSGFRRTNGYPSDMSARVDDGFLFINNIPVGRIASKINRPCYSAMGDYYEGRILARQEAQYDI